MNKYFYILALLALVLYTYLCYDAGRNDCKKDNEVKEQKQIISNQNETISIKDFQQKITNKPSNNSNIAFRRKWLFTLYAQREGK